MGLFSELIGHIDLGQLASATVTALVGFLIWLTKGAILSAKASSALHCDIRGTWYSAEFDTKKVKEDGGANRNTCLEVRLRRKLGGKVTIAVVDPIEDGAGVREVTKWVVNGRLRGDTLVGTWDGSAVKGSRRYGSVFLQFLEGGRAVGYWSGLAGVTRPMYGYFIMSRDAEERDQLASVIGDDLGFKAWDVAYVVEEFGRRKLRKTDVII